jgi:DNA repair protein RadC
VSHGTISASLVHPREVFKAALLSNAHTIIVAHNHPTGELTPSDEDLQTTEQLVKVGRLLGVSVLDHIIVSFRGIKSLREYHPDLFE